MTRDCSLFAPKSFAPAAVNALTVPFLEQCSPLCCCLLAFPRGNEGECAQKYLSQVKPEAPTSNWILPWFPWPLWSSDIFFSLGFVITFIVRNSVGFHVCSKRKRPLSCESPASVTWWPSLFIVTAAGPEVLGKQEWRTLGFPNDSWGEAGGGFCLGEAIVKMHPSVSCQKWKISLLSGPLTGAGPEVLVSIQESYWALPRLQFSSNKWEWY